MKIEEVSKEKIESMRIRLPYLSSILPLYNDDARYYLISEDGLFSVNFTVAIVVDGALDYITDNNYRESFERYLESKGLLI